MKAAVIGGGVLGLTLAHRLAKLGNQVDLIEAAPGLGGLAGPQQYKDFVWDRYYHCILPQDTNLISLLEELGMKDELRWTRTKTGYYAGGRFYSMSGNADYVRFPLLSILDKARLGVTVLHAVRSAKPLELYKVTAEEWLTRWCGSRCYKAFWQPLLKAKFGPYHDQVAAVFIWATLTRLQGARGAGAKEQLGYASGGYARILEAFEKKFRENGVTVRLGAPVTSIDTVADGKARVAWGGASAGYAEYSQVFFTGPTRLAKSVAAPSLQPIVERAEQTYPTSTNYLGVACLNLALKRPLTPYYVLNIADSRVELTGVIEMTNLVNRAHETKGQSLVYLPRYMDSADEAFNGSDDKLIESLLDRGVRRLFPDLKDSDIVDKQLHRARYVQPLPLVRHQVVGAQQPRHQAPLTILNTSMLECATLNNNEVVGLVERFVKQNRRELS